MFDKYLASGEKWTKKNKNRKKKKYSNTQTNYILRIELLTLGN